MRQSQLFSRTQKKAPKDEVSRNADLLTRGGFIQKMSAGVFAYLPLGWRVIHKITGIVQEEMAALGAQELHLPALVEKKYMDATSRWDVPIGFEVRGKNEKDAGFVLGWTHEEVITAIAAKFVQSYRDLPLSAYQIQNKFRNEARPQGGLLRTREFLMKDLYSFHATEDDFTLFYGRVADAYHAIFRRVGLTALYTVAGGGDFTGRNTHEFQVLADIGEDTVLVCDTCRYAENAEISSLKEGGKCPKCHGAVERKKAIEVGNIFPLGSAYADALSLAYVDENGARKPVIMGSYGIGIGRVMATAVEVSNDAKGIIWPDAIAPYTVHVLELPGGSGRAVYNHLQTLGIDVLFDDRTASAGEKFADADLMGIPWRFLVSEKTKGKIEVKKRHGEEASIMTLSHAIKKVSAK